MPGTAQHGAYMRLKQHPSPEKAQQILQDSDDTTQAYGSAVSGAMSSNGQARPAKEVWTQRGKDAKKSS